MNIWRPEHLLTHHLYTPWEIKKVAKIDTRTLGRWKDLGYLKAASEKVCPECESLDIVAQNERSKMAPRLMICNACSHEFYENVAKMRVTDPPLYTKGAVKDAIRKARRLTIEATTRILPAVRARKMVDRSHRTRG